MGIDEDSKQPRAYHHGDLKSALLEAAFVLLEEAGPEALSFREIARRVGVSRTAPYNHFESKEDLFITLAIRGLNNLQEQLVAAEKKQSTPKTILEARFTTYISFATTNPQLYRLMFGVGTGGWHAFSEMQETAKESYDSALKTLEIFFSRSGRMSEDVVYVSSIAAWSVLHGLSMLLIDGKLDTNWLEIDCEKDISKKVTDWFIAGLEAGADNLLRQQAPENKED